MELLPPPEVVRDPRDRAMDAMRERAIARCASGRRIVGNLADQAPDPPQEPLHPFDSGRSPRHVLVGRTDEQDREPGRIGSVHPDQLVGCRGAAHALRDLRAALCDEAVAEEALEWLAVNAQIEL